MHLYGMSMEYTMEIITIASLIAAALVLLACFGGDISFLGLMQRRATIRLRWIALVATAIVWGAGWIAAFAIFPVSFAGLCTVMLASWSSPGGEIFSLNHAVMLVSALIVFIPVMIIGSIFSIIRAQEAERQAELVANGRA